MPKHGPQRQRAAQVKAFRLMVNRSVNWADWDPEALALEFGKLKALDFDLSLTRFDPRSAKSRSAVLGTSYSHEPDQPRRNASDFTSAPSTDRSANAHGLRREVHLILIA